MSIRISGEVQPAFEPVRQLFQQSLTASRDKNAQLCIYVGDERVVDLCASSGSDDFSADSLVNVFSSGKSLESILMAMLADQGLLDFNALVSTYWPEFVGDGKEKLTVADVMRHEAGLAQLNVTLTAEQLQTSALKQNSVGSVLEQHPLRFPQRESPREYHAITRGWIVNEIFRRIEPNNRTLGEYLREQISAPLGIDLYLDINAEETRRLCRVHPRGLMSQIFDSFSPGSQARKIGLTPSEMFKRARHLISAFSGGRGTKAVPPLEGIEKETFSVFDSAPYLQAQTPSAGAKCSARGLAKLAAAMANGGQIDGQTVLGSVGFEALHAAPVERDMMIMNGSFTQGGVAQFKESDAAKGLLEAGLNTGRGGFYGWMGLGGSVFQWHPQHRIGFAYVPTALNTIDLFNERGKSYQKEVLKCVEAMA
jgi:CubicO group peptidase (beta-lactamase class C family)